MKLSQIMGAPMCLPSEIFYILYSQEWHAPADGYVRVCLSGGGGGGGGSGRDNAGNITQSGSGGAAALGFWRWKKIKADGVIFFAIGAAGGLGKSAAAGEKGGDGGDSMTTGDWGTMFVQGGSGGGGGPATNSSGPAQGSGGKIVTGADYFYAGETSDSNYIGGSQRPFSNSASVSALARFNVAPGWMGFFSKSITPGTGGSPGYLGNGVGSGFYSYYVATNCIYVAYPAGLGGGGIGVNGWTNNPTAGGAGYALLEFCQAVY